MDAVEFLKETNRMCKSFNDNCKNKDGNNFYCGLRYEANKNNEEYCKNNEEYCKKYIKNHPDKAVAIVEKWSREHPKETRQSEFLKLFPEAPIFEGVLGIEPCKLVGSKLNSEECRSYDEFGLSGCYECRKNYWLEEIE